MSVSAQVTPASAASTFPRSGSGAVVTAASRPTKNSARPTATTEPNARSRAPIGSRSSQGLRSMM